MNEAAKEAGVKIVLSDPKWDASAQVDNIRDFVTRRVDALAVFPIDVVGIEPAVREAKKEGVPVVAALGSIKGNSLHRRGRPRVIPSSCAADAERYEGRQRTEADRYIPRHARR